MKQYTTKEQTRHLIELGFEKPQSILDPYSYDHTDDGCDYDKTYSIGELIKFLGMHLMGIYPTKICDLPIKYVVQYKRNIKSVGYVQIQGELIDKLYNACVELKNEGII